MRIDYCDNCGRALSSTNRVSRRLEYSATLTPTAINIPHKPISIHVEAVVSSDVGLSRLTAQNGDFCAFCIEEVIINSIVERRANEQLAAEQEEEDYEDEEDSDQEDSIEDEDSEEVFEDEEEDPESDDDVDDDSESDAPDSSVE